MINGFGNLCGQVGMPLRRYAMGDKGGKKNKNKADKQKHDQVEKKKEQDKAKQPTSKL